MALPTYTLADLTKAVKHAIGGAVASTYTSETEIVNNALQFLVRSNNWKWRKRTRSIDFTLVAITTLARTSNVVTVTKTAHGLAVGDMVRISGATSSFNGSFLISTIVDANNFKFSQTASDEAASTPGSYIPGHVNLPSDFESIVSLQAAGLTLDFAPATIDQINLMRQTSYGIGFTWAYALSWSPQASVTAAPLARLEFHPIPDTTRADVGRLIYNRTIDNLANGTDLPDIPVYLHPVLKQLCRQFATQDEDQEDWKKIEGSRAEAMLSEAIANDTASQPVGGRLRSQLRPLSGGGMGDFPMQTMDVS